MTIAFKARVLLELGAELISSDAVALYELIKNGLDAGSTKIAIDVRVPLQPSSVRRMQKKLTAWGTKPWDVNAFLETVKSGIDETVDRAQREEILHALGRPTSADDARLQLNRVAFDFNTITVSDTGSGMSVNELSECYLTVGTPRRLLERTRAKVERADPSSHVLLGAKGIGRLAAMRIGRCVTVKTGRLKEKVWNELELDWRPIFDDSNLDASALLFSPRATKEKKSPHESGTEIRIRDIQSDWTEPKLRGMSTTDLAKLVDPFESNFANQFLSITLNGKKTKFLTGFQSSLLKRADAVCEISFKAGDPSTDDQRQNSPRLHVHTTYTRFGEAKDSLLEGPHLHSVVSDNLRSSKARRHEVEDPAEDIVDALTSLGSFSAKFYWFNRGRFMRDESEFWSSTLKPFVDSWSGGLLVFRDRYRVYPYGAASDDWLDLDRKALGASAYKLNRAQIIGYLRISSSENPRLQDQTNREGFRDSPERELLRRLLRYAIVADCKSFLEKVDRQQKDKEADEHTVERLESSIFGHQQSVIHSLQQLRTRVPAEAETVTAVLAQLAEVEDAWGRAKTTLRNHDAEVEQYVHLAGVGLMVELIAHELARTTDSALELLQRDDISTNRRHLDALEAQLKTLNKRVRVLDELSIPGRQKQVVQDVDDTARLMVDIYAEKAKRHNIALVCRSTGKKPLRRKIERGQMLQILDNLMSNAMYWQMRRVDREGRAEITIEIDAEKSCLRFSDNGPGIPSLVGERVFDPFYTTKPQRDGRGLGLYIAKRLAAENGADLGLLPVVDEIHTGFVLTFRSESGL